MVNASIEERKAIEALRLFYKNNDQESLKLFFTFYFTFIYRTAYYQVQNSTDAEDICQSVYLELLTSNARCDGAYEGISNKVKAWLGGIVLNKTRALYRQKESMKRRIYRRQQMEESKYLKDDVDKNNLELIDDAIKGLPKKYRVPLLLRYKEDLSFVDISEMLGLKPTTIRSQISRGLNFLRQQLKEYKVTISMFALIKLVSQIKIECEDKPILAR